MKSEKEKRMVVWVTPEEMQMLTSNREKRKKKVSETPKENEKNTKNEAEDCKLSLSNRTAFWWCCCYWNRAGRNTTCQRRWRNPVLRFIFNSDRNLYIIYKEKCV